MAVSIAQLAQQLRSGEASAAGLTAAALAAARAHANLNAFITLDETGAQAAAARADAALARADATALAGIPFAHKDIFCTQGLRTTCASRMLENFVPPYDATVVERLHAAHAVAIGKANMDEFAMGSSTEHSAFQLTANPWDLSRVPGGSSGGPAAAVAGDLATVSLGTDTGGSIRQPGAFCGVVGLKPTYGRVSRYGLVAFASSLDQIGPFAKDVRDAALVLQAIAGVDPADATSVDVPVPDYSAGLAQDVRGLRVGVLEFAADGMDPDVERAVRAAIEVLKGLGATTQTVTLPTADYGLAAYYIIAPAEASSNLARYDGVKYGLRTPGKDLIDMESRTRAAGFGAEVKRRIMLGTYALSAGYYDAYYGKAQKVRTLIRRDFEAAFEKVDVIVGPTTPGVAFKHGEKEDPLAMYLNDIFTVPANLAGNPGISVPCGFSTTGLPIGLHLVGRAFDEGTILRVAHAYEQATTWRRRRPELS